MKIAYVTSEFVTDYNGGGQATYIANIASIMANHGHEVFVFTKGNSFKRFLWKSGITVIYVNCHTDNHFISKLLGRYQVSFYINKTLNSVNKKEKFDVIQFSNLNGIPLLMSKKLPSIIRISDFSPAWDMALGEYFDLNHLKINKKEKQRFMAFRKAKMIFGPSKVCAELTSNYIGRRVDVIESPLSICDDIVKPQVFSEKLEGKKYLLFFGTMNYLKGIHVICKIADAFLEGHPDIYIAFLGANVYLPLGKDTIDAKTYIDNTVVKHRDRVIVLEPIFEKKYTNYILDRALACIMPSRIDNLPNTCIEAMALGKVVIGTRGASFDQLIEDGINGLLIDVDDANGLLEKMNALVNTSEIKIQEMGNKAKDTVQRMNSETIYRKLVSLYNQVANE